MDTDFLTNILTDLKEIYQNAVTEAKTNTNYVLVGELKKGDFYAKYNSLDDILKLIKNVQSELDELEAKEQAKEYGCHMARGITSMGSC